MALTKSQTTCSPVGALEGMDRAGEVTAAELHQRYLKDVYRHVL